MLESDAMFLQQSLQLLVFLCLSQKTNGMLLELPRFLEQEALSYCRLSVFNPASLLDKFTLFN